MSNPPKGRFIRVPILLEVVHTLFLLLFLLHFLSSHCTIVLLLFVVIGHTIATHFALRGRAHASVVLALATCRVEVQLSYHHNQDRGGRTSPPKFISDNMEIMAELMLDFVEIMK